jgi:hypothetical protein
MWQTLWRAVREAAAGIDAGSAVRLGRPVGGGHPARVGHAAAPTPRAPIPHFAASTGAAEWADTARSESWEIGQPVESTPASSAASRRVETSSFCSTAETW